MKRFAAAVAVIGALCCAPVALAQKAGGGPKTGPSALGWYDSTGKFVGNSVPGGALATVNGETAFLPMAMTPFLPAPTWLIGNSGRVWFASGDCSGTAYVSVTAVPGAMKYQAVFTNSGTPKLYFAGSTIDPMPEPMNSYHDDSNPRGFGCEIGTGAGFVVPAVSVQELSGLWTPPFVLR